jgi:hypothetical protein
VGIFTSFWGIEVCDKKLMKKIRRVIKWPPDDEVNTTINKKNAGETEKGWGKMSDMEGMHGESK